MADNKIWFEVDKSNGVLLSYFLKPPTNRSDKCDYIQGTQEELIYLNTLEDEILPPGMVVTLSDLNNFRARLRAANQTSTNKPTTPASKAPQRPPESASKTPKATLTPDAEEAKKRLIASIKQHHSHKKGK